MEPILFLPIQKQYNMPKLKFYTINIRRNSLGFDIFAMLLLIGSNHDISQKIGRH